MAQEQLPEPVISDRGDQRVDALVVGAGPAGLALAAALAERRCAVVLVDPAPTRPWTQTLGAWVDEVPADHQAHLACRWDDVRVVVEDGERRLGRAYALLDNEALRVSLLARLHGANGEVVRGRAARFAAGVRRHAVTIEADGAASTLRARAVIDAGGHRPALLRRPAQPPPPLQTAVGWFGHFATPPAAPGAMTLMDWTSPPAVGPAPPTFLYAMDLGDGRWLAEETSLAASPPVADDVLAKRLAARLDARGACPDLVEQVEHVRLPMGARLPDRTQPVVGFGAAAGFVHPATGFSVARSLRRCGRVADAIAEAVAAGAATDRVAEVGWAAVWSRDDLAQRRLFELGLASLLRLDAHQLAAFFSAFFDLPTARWSRYASGAGRAADVRAAMVGVLRAVPWSVRGRLLRAAVARRR